MKENSCVNEGVKPSVGFKLQISKDKINKMYEERSEQELKKIISEQKLMNSKRLLLLIEVYVFLFIAVNSIIYFVFNSGMTQYISFFVSNALLLLSFIVLSTRDAPVNN